MVDAFRRGVRRWRNTFAQDPSSTDAWTSSLTSFSDFQAGEKYEPEAGHVGPTRVGYRGLPSRYVERTDIFRLECKLSRKLREYKLTMSRDAAVRPTLEDFRTRENPREED